MLLKLKREGILIIDENLADIKVKTAFLYNRLTPGVSIVYIYH